MLQGVEAAGGGGRSGLAGQGVNRNPLPLVAPVGSTWPTHPPPPFRRRYGFRGFYDRAAKPVVLTKQAVEGIHLEGGTLLGTSRGGADMRQGGPGGAARRQVWAQRTAPRPCCCSAPDSLCLALALPRPSPSGSSPVCRQIVKQIDLWGIDMVFVVGGNGGNAGAAAIQVCPTTPRALAVAGGGPGSDGAGRLSACNVCCTSARVEAAGATGLCNLGGDPTGHPRLRPTTAVHQPARTHRKHLRSTRSCAQWLASRNQLTTTSCSSTRPSGGCLRGQQAQPASRSAAICCLCLVCARRVQCVPPPMPPCPRRCAPQI